MYYFHSDLKTIITISNDITMEKIIFWPHDINGELIKYEYINSNNDIHYIELKGSYYTANWAYIPFVVSVYCFWKVIFFIFEKYLMKCKNYSLFKYIRLIMFTLFWIYGFSSLLYTGDIPDSTTIVFMEFDHPILIKTYVYKYSRERIDYDINNDIIRKYAKEIGYTDDNGIGTQFFFNIIVIFCIYYILRWFYIFRSMLFSSGTNRKLKFFKERTC